MLQHCYNGTNYFTGETGIRIDYIALHKKVSFYIWNGFTGRTFAFVSLINESWFFCCWYPLGRRILIAHSTAGDSDHWGDSGVLPSFPQPPCLQWWGWSFGGLVQAAGVEGWCDLCCYGGEGEVTKCNDWSNVTSSLKRCLNTEWRGEVYQSSASPPPTDNKPAPGSAVGRPKQHHQLHPAEQRQCLPQLPPTPLHSAHIDRPLPGQQYAAASRPAHQEACPHCHGPVGFARWLSLYSKVALVQAKLRSPDDAVSSVPILF